MRGGTVPPLIDQNLLLSYRAEYQTAWEKSAAETNALFGALQAIERLLVLFEGAEKEAKKANDSGD